MYIRDKYLINTQNNTHNPARVMEELVALIIFILGCLQTHGITLCDKRRSDCCSGYMLRENEGRCVRCPVGYFGPLCQTPCPFPLYGQFCQTRCTCESSECNNIEGCPFTKGAAAFVTQTSAVPKEEVSVKQNQELRSRTTAYVHIPTVEDKGVQNADHPPSSTYVPTIDDHWASSVRMSIIILVGLCILLMALYAASFGIKLRRTENEPRLIQLEARDNYSI